ncbi:hypothetical protein MATL_G00244400 [Megalops atlanticus]|uniref:Transmembrane protein 53 n=1 Tax=Megalops atlanticus TaxID=7932 RepID=A0A9D3PER9_MEGAT|nr:hypothetical protein MATL_G00244400 [Megalops atlanticus]
MMSRSAAAGGVSALKISKTITFYMNESAVAATPLQGAARPLLLLLPWLGCRPQALAKYCELYFRTGFDVLVVESEVSQFLWPRWGLEYGAKLVEVLRSDRFAQRPLLVHAFSIGGYTFTQLLIHVSRDPQRHQDLTNRIKRSHL